MLYSVQLVHNSHRRYRLYDNFTAHSRFIILALPITTGIKCLIMISKSFRPANPPINSIWASTPSSTTIKTQLQNTLILTSIYWSQTMPQACFHYFGYISIWKISAGHAAIITHYRYNLSCWIKLHPSHWPTVDKLSSSIASVSCICIFDMSCTRITSYLCQ